MKMNEMKDYIEVDNELKAGVHEAVLIALNVLKRRHALHDGYVPFYIYLNAAADEFSKLTVKEMDRVRKQKGYGG